MCFFPILLSVSFLILDPNPNHLKLFSPFIWSDAHFVACGTILHGAGQWWFTWYVALWVISHPVLISTTISKYLPEELFHLRFLLWNGSGDETVHALVFDLSGVLSSCVSKSRASCSFDWSLKCLRLMTALTMKDFGIVHLQIQVGEACRSRRSPKPPILTWRPMGTPASICLLLQGIWYYNPWCNRSPCRHKTHSILVDCRWFIWCGSKDFDAPFGQSPDHHAALPKGTEVPQHVYHLQNICSRTGMEGWIIPWT